MAPTRQKNAAPPPVVANGHDHGASGDDITIEDATVIPDPNAPVVEPDVPAQPVEDPGTKELREQLAELQRKNSALEGQLTQERNERSRDQQVITDSRLTVLDSAIKSNELKRDEIRRRIKEAKEAGDYDAETAAVDELTQVNIDLKQIRMGKEQLEARIEAAKTTPQTEEERLQAWFETNKIHPRSQQWLRGHMEYLTDNVKSAELNLAHQKAIAEGNAVNSDAYFKAVEANLGLTQGGAPREEIETEKPTTERRQSAPVAPVSRSAPAGQFTSPIRGIVQTGPGKYSVTNDEHGRAIREAAEIAGIPIAQYVREALKLERGSDGQLH